ncbi:MAG: hypothetical protein A2041_12665 [Bacteroidetes bacterium GWA2_31_9b]|nr:MAG: hypothetical protein A2041_12665 [Bacteroidetes bacterium GWA2_31_9b]
MRKTLLLYIIFQVLISLVNAQSNYPLYVTPTLTPPYSLNLSDYSKFGSQKLMITIHANDLNISNLPVKLKIKMETMGVTVENPPTIVTTPIYINGGETTILFGTDLQNYFNINNLIFKGYSKETYNRTGQLPEGFYKFTVEVLHFNTNRIISNSGSATAWIALGKPPILKLPENNAQLGKFKGMPLTFSWLSSNVGSPVSANTIQYKFEMWEMHVPGINPNTIAATTPVFHESTSFNTLYTLYPNALIMTPGMQYAWRVTASDLSGFVPFEQNGQSEIRTFIYKAACDSITNFTSSHRGRNGLFSWDSENNHTSFNVEMHNPKTNWISNSQSYENKAEFFDLDYGATYEMRVQAVCDGDPESISDFSAWKQLTIPTPEPVDTADCPNCVCDDDIPPVELQNFDLRNDLRVGDTIVNKTGTSRFILKTVEPQGNGTYKGIFFFWAEIWKLKFICNYWDLQVNTDDVIVNMDFESVYDPQFLIDVDATIDYLDSLAGIITTLTTDITPDDTLTITETITTIYVNEGDSVIVVTVDEDGNITETVLSDNVDNLEETLIVGENGEEYVVTGDGELMGIDEYVNTGGGQDSEIEDYNEEKENNNLSDDVTVNFTGNQNQKYGFDKYNDEKSSLQSTYPSLNNGYQPAYKSIASFSTDIVSVSNSGGNIIFKDELGIPAIKAGEDISLRGSSSGSDVAMYAYQVINDSTEKIAGKLNILSFDEQAKKLYIVSVNGAATPDETSLQEALNKVYKQAVTSWTVTKLNDLKDIVFENGNMTHGGSSAISVYNIDQRTIVNTFEDANGKLENNAYYLFFVENVQFKESSIAGYMPLQRQVGFIYDNPNLNIIAHELGHGAFNLWHTFSPDNFIATEHSTENLMDYKGGIDLWKHQWQLVQSPDKMLFAWMQDESEGEAVAVKEYYISIDGKKALKIDIEKIEDEFDKTKSLSIEELNNYDFKTLQIFVLGSDKNDFKLSSMYIKNGEIKGEMPRLVWDIKKAKDINVSFKNINAGEESLYMYYTSETGEQIYPVFNIEIVRIIPNIAYKQDALTNCIIREDKVTYNITNEIELSGSKVSLRPVFFTYKEKGGVEDLTTLFKRNELCSYLISSVKFQDEQVDPNLTLDWIEYSLSEDESNYEFIIGEESVKGIIKKATFSPFVTIIRHKLNEETGYYIEDFYSTYFAGVSPYPSLRDENNSMKSGDFDLLGVPFKIPIVQFKNTCNVKLLLSDVPRSQNPSPLQYKLGNKIIELGKEFSILTPPSGNILDIKDVDDNIKGKIEFKQIIETQLVPILNFVTINTEESETSYSTVINDINAIYNTINVSWQQGNHIVLNVNPPYSLTVNSDLSPILNALRAHVDYNPNQYYMIISPELDDFGGYAGPSLEDNWFVIQKTYDKRVPAHELGHCNGLDEYAVNIGLLPASQRNQSSLKKMQYLTSNVMGYSKEGQSNANPLLDFYSWQIPLLRQKISIRINSK